MISKENIAAWLEELVKVPSISGTKNENLGALKVHEMLGRMNYFKTHPEALQMIPLEADKLNRNVVLAFAKSQAETKKTIIITGHYDVVGVEEYGLLKDFAFDVNAITSRIRELRLDADTIHDLDFGQWLFGRGVGDMKYGLALCMETLRYFTEEETLNTNLLFLGVPGEETNSEGMLQAVKLLYKMQEHKHLEFKALLNTEAYFPDEKEPDKNRYIHIGSSGKVMPLFLFCGEGTHAGELAFDGFDANLMATKFHEMLHHNAEFCQTDRGMTTPPPACLKMTDLKDTYSITTPIYSAAYYNLITLNLDAPALVKKLKELSYQAFENAIDLDNKRAAEYQQSTGQIIERTNVIPKVVMFQDLYRSVESTFNGDFNAHIKSFTSKLMDNGLEIQDISIQLFREVADHRTDRSPMIVLGFIPPYYPDNYPDESMEETKELRQCISYITQYAEEQFQQSVKTKDFYMGLSDMCYTGLRSEYDYHALFENIIGMNDYYQFPENELSALHIPSIVFGPYAKDAHKCSERLNIPYNFDVLPFLFIEFIRKMGK